METETDQSSLHMDNNHERIRVQRGDDDHDDDGGIGLLPDDVLLEILRRLDLRTAVKAGAVARRWRQLPRLLPDLDIDVATMVPLLRLAFYLVDGPYLCSIGDAMTAITAGRLELTILTAYVEFTVQEDQDYLAHADPPGVVFGRRFASFLAAYPLAFSQLTSLALQDIVFSSMSEITRLLNTCHRLEILSLTHCAGSVLEINASSLSLLALELQDCFFDAVELSRVPKLERLVCDASTTVQSMRFGCVPCLGIINLSARHLQCYFDSPAGMSPAFSSLTDVYLCNLDISKMAWILSVLDAAPFLNNLYIEVRFYIRHSVKFLLCTL
ncbi:hypothetical protein VPH35_005223 [Triticum aestivum]